MASGTIFLGSKSEKTGSLSGKKPEIIAEDFAWTPSPLNLITSGIQWWILWNNIPCATFGLVDVNATSMDAIVPIWLPTLSMGGFGPPGEIEFQLRANVATVIGLSLEGKSNLMIEYFHMIYDFLITSTDFEGLNQTTGNNAREAKTRLALPFWTTFMPMASSGMTSIVTIRSLSSVKKFLNFWTLSMINNLFCKFTRDKKKKYL